MSAAGGGASEWFALFNFTTGGTDGFTQVRDMAINSSGDIYAVSAGASNAAFAVFDNQGNLDQSKIADPNDGGTNIGYGAAIDGSDNFILYGTDGPDAYLEKFNSSTTSQWSYTYDNPDAAWLIGTHSAVAADSSDNVYYGGGGYSQFYNHIAVFKLNSSGTLQWKQMLGTTKTEAARGIALNSSETKVGFCGYNRPISSRPDAVAVGVLNASDGSVDWSGSYYFTAPGFEPGQSGGNCAFDSNGNLIASANAWIGPPTDRKCWVAKFNTSGTLQWQKFIAVSGSDRSFPFGLAVDDDDNTYIGIQGQSGFFGGVIKLNSSGAKVWDISIAGSTGSGYSFFLPYSIKIDPDGALIIGGVIRQDSPVLNLGLVMRTNTDGPATGTYGDITIGTPNLTVSNGTLVSQSGSTAVSSDTHTRVSTPTTLTNQGITSTTTSL